MDEGGETGDTSAGDGNEKKDKKLLDAFQMPLRCFPYASRCFKFSDASIGVSEDSMYRAPGRFVNSMQGFDCTDGGTETYCDWLPAPTALAVALRGWLKTAHGSCH